MDTRLDVTVELNMTACTNSCLLYSIENYGIVQCLYCGRWRSKRSWRTGQPGVVSWRGVGVCVLGTSVLQGHLYFLGEGGMS